MFQAIWKKVVPKSKFWTRKSPKRCYFQLRKEPLVLKFKKCYLVAGLVKSTDPTSFLGWARSNLYRCYGHCAQLRWSWATSFQGNWAHPSHGRRRWLPLLSTANLVRRLRQTQETPHRRGRSTVPSGLWCPARSQWARHAQGPMCHSDRHTLVTCGFGPPLLAKIR